MERNTPKIARGVTLIELLTVVLIIGILSTIATNVYIGQTLRAKNASTRNTIREISVAVVRHEIDTGELPLSGSGDISSASGAPAITSRVANAGLSALTGRNGCGLLYAELVHSLSGQVTAPYPNTWAGPYLEFQAKFVQTTDDAGLGLPFGQIQMLDAFGNPFEYINFLEYSAGTGGGSLTQHLGITGIPPYSGVGTFLFQAGTPVPPPPTNPDLPTFNIFFVAETFYNPRSFQIYSTGSDGQTAAPANPNYQGTQADDLSNFTF